MLSGEIALKNKHYYYYYHYLYVPDEGSLLPKFRDCTTSNDFELCIYIYICTTTLYIFVLLINNLMVGNLHTLHCHIL